MSQLEPGELWLSVNYVGGPGDRVGKLHIDRADPVIWVAKELLDEMRGGNHHHPDVEINDGLLTIRGSNRTVFYRVGEHVGGVLPPAACAYLCHWPD